jgi:hypothetical protein
VTNQRCRCDGCHIVPPSRAAIMRKVVCGTVIYTLRVVVTHRVAWRCIAALAISDFITYHSLCSGLAPRSFRAGTAGTGFSIRS